MDAQNNRASTDCSGGTAAEDFSLCVKVETVFGEKVLAVGNVDALGSWRPEAGQELTTGPETYPYWLCAAKLPCRELVGESVEFKFVIVRPDGTACWEPGQNRRWHHDQAVSGEQRLPTMHFGEVASDKLQFRSRASGPSAFEKSCLLSSGCNLRREGSSSTCCHFSGDDETSPASTSRSTSCLLTPKASSEDVSRVGSNSLGLWAGAHRTPKPRGRCEDAYFFSQCAAGVADGVGQMVLFADFGVDAAAYAAELMELSACALGHSEVEGSPCEKAAGAVAVAEARAQTYGASTITVLVADGAGFGVANLGDSGFLHLRATAWGMDVVDWSREQQHGWNCPYQLTHVPQALEASQKRFDTAADCELYPLAVQAGDLILLYTDGLTDNLHWHEITSTIDKLLECDRSSNRKTSPGMLARALTRKAQERSMDAFADTPFSVGARRHNLKFSGGKVDDITVVAAWVVPDTEQQLGAEAATLSSPRHAKTGCKLRPVLERTKTR